MSYTGNNPNTGNLATNQGRDSASPTGTNSNVPGRGVDSQGNAVSLVQKPPPVEPFVLGEGLDIQNSYVIDQNKDNIIEHYIKNKTYDLEDIQELQDRTIFELIPTPPERPTHPPISGKLYVANWSRVLNFGGVTNKNFNPDIERTTDWSSDQWETRHRWPKDYTLDPTYLFFTGDPPIFYTSNAISHLDEAGIPVPVPDSDIIWKLDGKVVHQGWYLDLDDVTETVDRIPVGGDDGDEFQTIMIPRTIRCEITNKAGMIADEVKYSAINSDNASELAGISEVDNFTSNMEGRFVVDSSNRSVSFEPDERYQQREMFARFQWKDIGSGKSKVSKFKGRKCKVKVDGVTVYHDEPIKLDGQRSALGEFFDDIVAPFLAVAGAVAGLVAGILFTGLTGGLGYALFGLTSSLALANAGKFLEIFDDSGNILDDNRPLGERGVTDWTNGRPSALLYTDADDDEWNQLVAFVKKPGPFTINIKYSFTYIKWFKKYRRTYELTIPYTNGELHLDVPLQGIDIGLFTIPYSDERA